MESIVPSGYVLSVIWSKCVICVSLYFSSSILVDFDLFVHYYNCVFNSSQQIQLLNRTSGELNRVRHCPYRMTLHAEKDHFRTQPSKEYCFGKFIVFLSMFLPFWRISLQNKLSGSFKPLCAGSENEVVLRLIVWQEELHPIPPKLRLGFQFSVRPLGLNCYLNH